MALAVSRLGNWLFDVAECFDPQPAPSEKTAEAIWRDVRAKLEPFAPTIYDSAAALLAAKYDVTVWYDKAPDSEHVTSCIWRQSGRA